MFIKKLLRIGIIVLLLFPGYISAYNKSVIDITKMDIKMLSEALELKIITSEELVTLYLDRIEAYDENYNAIITINEKALEEARNLDQLRSEGKVKSSLHGIPIIVKDNIDVLGMPTTAGSKALKDNFPKSNSIVVQKLIDAGAVILAKANMSEFAFEASSSRSSHGTVKNAYNVNYSSYGSSGGSAVSVAASFAAAALGTDTNSSIRLPAAATNIVGLRPTMGLVSQDGVLPYDSERDTVGTLTKTVVDSITIMNIINEQDSKNYKSTKTDLEGIIIGIPLDFLKGDDSNNLPENKETYAEIQKLMGTAIKKLENQKAKIVYLDEYYNYQTDAWFANSLSGYLFCDSFNNYLKNTEGTIRSFAELAISTGRVTSLDDYVSSCNSNPETILLKNKLKDNYRDYIKKIMKDNEIDVIAYPTTKNKLLKSNDYGKAQNLSAHASSTINYPAITLPLGFDEEGLPYGIEFMAPINEEQLLYEISSIYEKENNNQITPNIAPSLYDIPAEVQKLVVNYTNQYKKDSNFSFEKEWIKNVQNYFNNYNENSDEETAKSLNSKYYTNNWTSIILINVMFLAKWFFIIVVNIIILLLIRKKIIKNTKLRKKRRKT